MDCMPAKATYRSLVGRSCISGEGLHQVNGQFIPLPDDVTRTSRDSSQVNSMKPAALREAGLTIHSTKRPQVFLCPGPIPLTLLNFGACDYASSR